MSSRDRAVHGHGQLTPGIAVKRGGSWESRGGGAPGSECMSIVPRVNDRLREVEVMKRTSIQGILVAIAEKFKLPVHAVGVGEGVDDLQPFKAAEFAKAIAAE